MKPSFQLTDLSGAGNCMLQLFVHQCVHFTVQLQKPHAFLQSRYTA